MTGNRFHEVQERDLSRNLGMQLHDAPWSRVARNIDMQDTARGSDDRLRQEADREISRSDNERAVAVPVMPDDLTIFEIIRAARTFRDDRLNAKLPRQHTQRLSCRSTSGRRAGDHERTLCLPEPSP